MSKHHKLSLGSAILVNLNVMFGTGIFINTVYLAKLAGFLGFLSYIVILIFIFPLIVAIASLLNRHPNGGFYTYAGKDLNQGAGFTASYAYFIGKLASGSLLVHVFSSLIQTIIPSLQIINVFVLDILIISLFTWLNTFNMKTSKSIMYLFLVLKIFPILFAILSCMYLYNYWTIPPETVLWSGIPSTLPLVLFAFGGFEAACSLSSSIKNAKRNAPLAIFISFGFVVLITITYPLLFFLTAGKGLMMQENFLGIFPSLLTLLVPDNLILQKHLISILYIALATASLGGAYGIIFSNHWNLYTLAQHNHTFFKNALTKLNKHHIPTLCVVIEGALCILYLLITKAEVMPLQQISVLGLSIAYTMSVLGLLNAQKLGKNINLDRWTPWLALGSCFVFIATITRNFIHHGIFPLLIFGCLLLFGLFMYLTTKKQYAQSANFNCHQSNKTEN